MNARNAAHPTRNVRTQIGRAELLFASLLIFACSAGFVARGAGTPPAEAVEIKGQAAHPTRLLARYKAGAAHAKTTGAIGASGMEVRRGFATVPGMVVLDLPKTKARAAATQSKDAQRDALMERREDLKATGLFEYVELDWVRYAEAVPSDSAFADGTLWGLRNTGQSGGVAGVDVGAEAAWDVTTGSSDVIVAVIDTGINYNHQDLTGNLWHNPGETPGNGIDDDANGIVDDVYGINAVSGDGDPLDDHSHGSHCAGTIGATANGGGPHVGVCWNVRLMACKFLDSGGSGYTSDAIACIDYAVENGARILSNSWGGGGYSTSLRNAIAGARDAGVLFVAAAGNDGEDNDRYPHYPSSYDVDNIIAVAAIDRAGALAGFSNYGDQSVDIGAPGVSIYSSTATSNSSYASYNGTSMATPHVSGVAALICAVEPTLSVEQLRQRIFDTAVPTASLQGITATGGRANAADAVTNSLLAEAVDATGFGWSTTGDADWRHQTTVTFDGADAAASGAIGDSQSTTLQTAIAGPGNLSFRWKASSESGGDLLRFSVDDVPQGEISGETDWQQADFSLTPGSHTLTWTYQKNGSVAAGADTGWVDTVSFVSTAPPAITSAATARGLLGYPFTYLITATASPTGFGVTGTLPDGLALDSNSGVISGTPTSIGTTNATVEATNAYGTGTAPLSVEILDFTLLGEAVDAPGYPWLTGGDGLWYGVSDTTYDGSDAARSGVIHDDEASYLETTITGPAIIQFRWRVDSEDNYDYLDFLIDGTLRAGISGPVDWELQTDTVASGAHTIRWEYSKDFSVSSGEDAGWVDTVNLIVDPPAITSPAEANGNVGVPFSYQITATNVATAFSVVGSLPPGLSFDSATGVIGGFPTSGGTTVVTVGATNIIGTGTRSLAINISEPPPLADVLDAAGLTWTTGGDANWFGQTQISYDGVDAACSILQVQGQSSYLETAVAGPSLLAFYWKLVGSGLIGDSVTLYLDGQVVTTIDSNTDWRLKACVIPEGSHTVRWVYTHGSPTWTAQYGAWVDAVAVEPYTPPTASCLIQSGASGTPVSGEPAGTYFSRLGIPSVNDAGTLAFLATIKSGSTSHSAILRGLTPSVLIRQGGAAPGTGGATFRTFKDPLLDQAGHAAFIAMLTGTGVSATTDSGVWSDAFGSGIQLVAREGDPIPGGSGDWLRAFNSVALDGGTAATPMVAFVAKLKGATVTTANDVGLFSFDGTTTRTLLREGATMIVDGGEKTISKFTALTAPVGTQGHGFGLGGGAISALLKFSDASAAIATIYADGTAPDIVAFKGDAAPGYSSGEWFNVLKTPVQNALGGAVFSAAVTGSSRSMANTSLFAVTGGAAGPVQEVVRRNGSVEGMEDVVFTGFTAAANNAADQVAFIARIAGSLTHETSDTGIWVTPGQFYGPVAREGGAAPGAGGATWKTFTSVALSDRSDILFAATLNRDAGTPLTASGNDAGLWSGSEDGIVELLLREGVTVVDGKTVKSFKVLGKVALSPSQARSYNGNGGVVYLATFTDGTQGIVEVQLP